jgi:hypothetical protein
MTKSEIHEYRRKLEDKNYIDIAIHEIVRMGAHICIEERITKRNKRVVCVETNEVYESIANVAKVLCVSASSVSIAIAKNYKCKGYHWRYA